MSVPNRDADVIKDYQLTNLVNNNNKWWRIEWWKTERITRVTYGRVGQECARPSVKTGIDHYKFDKMLRDREKPKDEGTYKEVIKGQKIVSNADTTGLSTKLVNRIQKILQAANESINSFLTVNVENLSIEQIDLGAAKLAEIVNGKKFNDTDLIKLATEYYNIIPTRLSHKINAIQVARNLKENAADEEDRLQQLAAAIKGFSVASSGGSLLDQLGCELYEPTDEEYKACVQQYETTKRHAGRDAKVKEVWKVKIPSERAAFENYPIQDNKKLLFHGTNSKNVRHINRTGLIIPKYAANGSMYGRGIYLANASTKSLGYCGNYGEKYMFLVEAILGKQYTTYSTGSWTEPPKGYDSIYAPAGRQNGAYSGYLGYDEFMVYRKEQQTIRYMLVLE